MSDVERLIDTSQPNIQRLIEFLNAKDLGGAGLIVAALSDRLQSAEQENAEAVAQRDSLRLELDACEFNRRRDNTLLIGERDEAVALLRHIAAWDTNWIFPHIEEWLKAFDAKR
jgi:hypothetical protein